MKVKSATLHGDSGRDCRPQWITNEKNDGHQGFKQKPFKPNILSLIQMRYKRLEANSGSGNGRSCFAQILLGRQGSARPLNRLVIRGYCVMHMCNWSRREQFLVTHNFWMMIDIRNQSR